jgi:hypothetical protein
MSSTEGRRAHPLTVIHMLAMFAVLTWWSVYFWRHAPAREILQQHSASVGVARGAAARGTRIPGTLRGRGGPGQSRDAFPGIGRAATQTLREATDRAAAAVQTSMADIAGGVVVLLVFAIGSGIYVRRIEIWLQARSSGDAMDLAGSGLGDRALAANAGRRLGDPGAGAR